MGDDLAAAFSALKPVLAKHAKRLAVKVDGPSEYTLLTKSPSPFPNHKGNPMYFGSVRQGKAYVSFHLMPLYMCPPLTGSIPPDLKRRMHGKTCFNFKDKPAPELIAELKKLTSAGLKAWGEKGWL